MAEISIILPVYNGEKFIAKTIDSILEQSFRDFELIIINDGSRDKSEDICLRKARRDKRIKYFYQENHGISYSRNKGIKLAEGKYCAFCDHDDIFDENLLKENLKVIKDKKTDIVKFGRKIIFPNKIEKTKFYKNEVFVVTKENITAEFSTLSKGPLFLYVWDSLIKLEFLRKEKIFFDERFRSGEEDRNLMFECILKGATFAINPKCYYNHFIRGNLNTTSSYSLNRANSVIISAINEEKVVNEFNIGQKYWDNQKINYFILFLIELSKGEEFKRNKEDILLRIVDFKKKLDINIL